MFEVADRYTVEKFRTKTSLDAAAKRRAIAAVTAATVMAAQLPPHKAMGMLTGIWTARTGLDWGCRPIVGR